VKPVSVVQYFLISFCYLLTFDVSAQCEQTTDIGYGNWKEEILSASQRLSILEMELKKSLMSQQDCLDTGAVNESRGQVISEGVSVTSAQGLDAEAGNAAVSSQRLSSADRFSNNDASTSSVSSNSTRNDPPENSENLSSEEDTLERVLREAIQKEPDPVKRRALIDRYRQLFGEFVNL
jgi:hypothetical protein